MNLFFVGIFVYKIWLATDIVHVFPFLEGLTVFTLLFLELETHVVYYVCQTKYKNMSFFSISTKLQVNI